ncbi:MAG: sigma-70 family RNA polymerase sigma factor [Armatimonadetes bacterium]|nr:sigma-70 family RNA polymerase sigma factor [Armatimonadota bacterium]
MPDGELVLWARRGCSYAAEELVRRYSSLVRASARAFFMPGSETEDVVQEGMVGLVKAIQSYSGGRGSSFRSFAELCVTRQLISAVKGARRYKHELLTGAASLHVDDGAVSEDRPSVLSIPAPDSVRPDRIAEVRLILRELVVAMREELSEAERRALQGHLQGLSYSEVARRLGRDCKSVDNAIQRAKKKVAKRVSEVLYLAP